MGQKKLLVSRWLPLCYDVDMQSIPLGELMTSVFKEMLEVYNDEELAALATVDFINKYLKQIETEESPQEE